MLRSALIWHPIAINSLGCIFGAIWAAQRVPDDHVCIVPNWSIIKRIDLAKPEEFMASANYKRFAIDRKYKDLIDTMYPTAVADGDPE